MRSCVCVSQPLHCDRSRAELKFRPVTMYRASAVYKDVTTVVPPSTGQELLVLVGPPASGKSAIARALDSSHIRVNQDTLKTRKKCESVAAAALAAGDSVTIDATNRDVATRSAWVQMARAHVRRSAGGSWLLRNADVAVVVCRASPFAPWFWSGPRKSACT